MNATRRKQVKLLVTQLPVSYEIIVKGQRIRPHEVLRKIDEGITPPPGFNLSSDTDEKKKWYRYRKQDIVMINHYKRIKKAYNKRGEQGVVEYLKWLKQNNIRVAKIISQIDSNIKIGKWSSQLDRLILGGAKSFWKNLIIFLASFLTFFINNEEDESTSDTV